MMFVGVWIANWLFFLGGGVVNLFIQIATFQMWLLVLKPSTVSLHDKP